MNAAEMAALCGIKGPYEAWCFGDDPDGLASLVLAGRKTATASAFPIYAAEGEALPQAGEYSVILDSRGNAVCVIRTTRVYVTPFHAVPASHAAREGEGDLSLAFWRRTHRAFFQKDMEQAGLQFDEQMPVVCEEFEKVYPKEEH